MKRHLKIPFANLKKISHFAKSLFATAVLSCTTLSASAEDLVCWFAPGSNPDTSKQITEALSTGAGVEITPRIAGSYPEIFKALQEKPAALIYTGSFSAALLIDRGIAVPLVQRIDGKELYCGVLIYPKGGDPAAILKDSPSDISYAIGASSGESSAKAATAGKASVGVKDHASAVNAVRAESAKAAVVKSHWWEGNKAKYAEFDMYLIPEISVAKNPDNILLATVSIPEALREKIEKVALASASAFGATSVSKVNTDVLQFTLDLMKKGNIDPKTYSW